MSCFKHGSFDFITTHFLTNRLPINCSVWTVTPQIWWTVPACESYQGVGMTADEHWIQSLPALWYCCMSHGWWVPLALVCPGTCTGCCSQPSSHPGCAQPTPEHRDISACQHHNNLLLKTYLVVKNSYDSAEIILELLLTHWKTNCVTGTFTDSLKN
jgi:hypothetical protein